MFSMILQVRYLQYNGTINVGFHPSRLAPNIQLLNRSPTVHHGAYFSCSCFQWAGCDSMAFSISGTRLYMGCIKRSQVHRLRWSPQSKPRQEHVPKSCYTETTIKEIYFLYHSIQYCRATANSFTTTIWSDMTSDTVPWKLCCTLGHDWSGRFFAIAEIQHRSIPVWWLHNWGDHLIFGCTDEILEELVVHVFWTRAEQPLPLKATESRPTAEWTRPDEIKAQHGFVCIIWKATAIAEISCILLIVTIFVTSILVQRSHERLSAFNDKTRFQTAVHHESGLLQFRNHLFIVGGATLCRIEVITWKLMNATGNISM